MARCPLILTGCCGPLVSEARFFDPATTPDFTTPDWYAGRDRAPHLEQPGHRPRLLMAADMVRQAIRDYGVCTVSDMGAGDGGLLSLLTDVSGVDVWGYDLQPSNVDAAVSVRGVNVRLADVLGAGVVWGDLAVCTEMLEHLVDPHGFVADMPSRVLVASSPLGETAGSHYEFHCWGWDMDGYRAMVEQGGFGVVEHVVVGGFQVVLAARPQEAL